MLRVTALLQATLRKELLFLFFHLLLIVKDIAYIYLSLVGGLWLNLLGARCDVLLVGREWYFLLWTIRPIVIDFLSISIAFIARGMHNILKQALIELRVINRTIFFLLSRLTAIERDSIILLFISSTLNHDQVRTWGMVIEIVRLTHVWKQLLLWGIEAFGDKFTLYNIYWVCWCFYYGN